MRYRHNQKVTNKTFYIHLFITTTLLYLHIVNLLIERLLVVGV